MYLVRKKSEPEEFDSLVRKPGEKFLKENPNPTREDWKNKKNQYWTRISEKLYDEYNGICAYSWLWFSTSSGAKTVDHFKPKSKYPSLAYEWKNYRLVSLRFNSRKGVKRVLDPFLLHSEFFILEFPSLIVKPAPGLSICRKKSVEQTIRVLKLDSDESFRNACNNWLKDYCSGEITFDYLKKKAPFIASQLELQTKLEEIKNIMVYPDIGRESI